MSAYSLVITGLSTELFDRVRKISSERLAPNGNVYISPNTWHGAYDPKHVQKALNGLYNDYSARKNEVGIPTLLLYVDFGEDSTSKLLESFFPFALPMRLSAPNLDAAPNTRTRNELLNKFETEVLNGARKLRETSNKIAHYTDKANLNPLLLPLRNFAGGELHGLLRDIYDRASYEEDTKALVDKLLNNFSSKHPWVTPPDSGQRAMSDGVLYFKSPGKNRHGFLRNSDAKNHERECLLNARSRLGAKYSFDLHYDCTPVKGKLKPKYDNCHGHESSPKPTHVNIAPNDYII